MANFTEMMGKAPKWALIAGAAVILALLGYGMYYLTFGGKKPQEEVPQKILLDMPDAPEDGYSTSALDEFGRSKTPGRSRVEDYWDSLEDPKDDVDGGNLLTMEDDLDPNVYTEQEIRQIRSGFRTREDIDREHELEAARKKQLEDALANAAFTDGSVKQKALTPEQQDSIYMARLERAYSLAYKFSAQPVETPVETPAGEEEEEEGEQERKLDLETEPTSLPTDSFVEDGIITSLDSPSTNGVVHYGSGVKPKPVKATFLKDEKLVSGNRVIMRLMQDMTLADGTIIPANTHITGTCNISRRMKINVTVLHYGGRMFPVDISVYDNDGTEGIYCPLVQESNNVKRKAKRVAEGVVSSASTVAGTLVTGNPLLGSMASRGFMTATSSIGDDGTVSVNVSSGYEFYVYENVKDK